jgi:hypothetical protein
MSDFARYRTPAGRPRGGLRLWLPPLLAVGFLLGGAGLARAFDDDTHFALTYYLARKLGYTKEEAYKVASADVSVDTNDNTSPLGWTDSDKRRKFHAFPDSDLPEGARQAALQALQDALWDDALKTGNPGAFLHFAQDKISHQDFGNYTGQAWGLNGHRADFLSADQPRARQVTWETVNNLKKFLKEYLGRDAKPLLRKEIDGVLQQLIDANPAPNGLRDRLRRRPDLNKALAIIQKALGEEIPAPHKYGFNTQGAPIDADWDLTGPSLLDRIQGPQRLVFDESQPKYQKDPPRLPRVPTPGYQDPPPPSPVGPIMPAPQGTTTDDPFGADSLFPPSGSGTGSGNGNPRLTFDESVLKNARTSGQGNPGGYRIRIITSDGQVVSDRRYDAQGNRLNSPGAGRPAARNGTGNIWPGTRYQAPNPPNGKGDGSARLVFDETQPKPSNKSLVAGSTRTNKNVIGGTVRGVKSSAKTFAAPTARATTDRVGQASLRTTNSAPRQAGRTQVASLGSRGTANASRAAASRSSLSNSARSSASRPPASRTTARSTFRSSGAGSRVASAASRSAGPRSGTSNLSRSSSGGASRSVRSSATRSSAFRSSGSRSGGSNFFRASSGSASRSVSSYRPSASNFARSSSGFRSSSGGHARPSSGSMRRR